MKLLFVLVAMAAFAFANDDGCTDTAVGINPPASGTDAVSLTVVNDWGVLPSGEKGLGLDVFENASMCFVLDVNHTAMYVRAWDAATGGMENTLPLDAANANGFGLAWNNDFNSDTYYTNDFVDNVLYYTDDFGSSWTTVANPANNNGRGMDFDGTDYWSTNGDGGGLWRFQPGVGAQNIAIPEVPTQPSGLAVFPNGSDIGIALTCYNTHNIYFYNWNGSALSYLGSAACPVTCSYSYGLTYAQTTGNLYWSFNNGGYCIAEVSFSLTSLSRDTWAGIKTSF